MNIIENKICCNLASIIKYFDNNKNYTYACAQYIYMRSEQLIWFYCFNRIRHVLLCFCLHSFRTYKITCYFLPAICFHTPNQCIHTHSIVQHFHG